jgi:hypothetical protein
MRAAALSAPKNFFFLFFLFFLFFGTNIQPRHSLHTQA